VDRGHHIPALLLALIHRSAWRDCMKRPHALDSRLTMRRIMAAYTNASPLAHSLSKSLLILLFWSIHENVLSTKTQPEDHFSYSLSPTLGE
jgi:hypothetical protein